MKIGDYIEVTDPKTRLARERAGDAIRGNITRIDPDGMIEFKHCGRWSSVHSRAVSVVPLSNKRWR